MNPKDKHSLPPEMLKKVEQAGKWNWLWLTLSVVSLVCIPIFGWHLLWVTIPAALAWILGLLLQREAKR